jgi:uncharacterized repeat protein (TIGR01451 family)
LILGIDMRTLSLLLFLTFSPAAVAQSPACISIAALDSAYEQNFNTLASSGTSSTLPLGWYFAESGTNANSTYTAGNGSSNTGDTYSFGATGSSERALGGLQSGSLTPTIGACFTNNTGKAIARLRIGYQGEQWRFGATGRQDRIEFSYSLNASAVNSGAPATWTGVAGLNYVAPQLTTVGAVNPPNTAAVSGDINTNIAAGATFWIRWTSVDVTGADDGLAVDDFSLTAEGFSGVSISDATVTEGDSGQQAVSVIVSLDKPAAVPVTFDIATSDGSATAADSDYQAKSLTNQTIPAGQTSYTFTVNVNGDTKPEPTETFVVSLSNVSGATVSKADGVITIVNDDILPISAIQGFDSESPYNGQVVITTGVVTARKSNGFFLQTPDGAQDANPLTSEGIFVFTGSPVPAGAAVGNVLKVTGTVTEFRPSADPGSYPITELTTPVITVLGSSSLPAPIVLTTAHLTPGGGLEQLERFESMRVKVETLQVVAPTSAFSRSNAEEASGISVSNGVFFGVIAGTPRPFREAGVQQPDPLPAGSPCCVPRFDNNPERIRVDSDGQPGAPAIEVATGAVITNIVGPLDYSFRSYTILPDATPAPGVTPGMSAVAVPVAGAGQFTVASFNMERFYDTTNDPGGDVVMTADGYNGRLNKASLAIRNLLRTPDILAVVEVENLSTLQAIAARIGADAVAAGQPNPMYAAYLVQGNDSSNINVGFLVKSGRVSVVDVTQVGKDATYTDPNTGNPALLNDRPPLVLRAQVQPPNGNAFPVTVIVNHLRSLGDINSPTDGNRVRTKRASQAEFLASLVQARQTNDPSESIVLVGDFNAFEFNDGFADLIGTIRGVPAAPVNVVKSSPDLVNPDLADAAAGVTPSTQRYSYVFDGNAQSLDHVLITQNLLPRLAQLAFMHSDADFPESFRGDFTRPERLSDHDAPVAYFNFPTADLSLGLTSGAAVTGQTLTYTLLVKNELNDAALNAQLTFTLPAQTSFSSYNAPGWSCTAASTVTCTKASVAAQSTETVTVTVSVPCTLVNGAQLAASASLSSQTFEADLSNNTRSLQVSVSNPAPVLSTPVVDTPVIWPPNGKFVDVNVSYGATDGGCGGVVCSLSVTSSEPVDGRGDGKRSDAWEVVSPTLVRLRAERSGLNDGRTYTITVTCTDLGGATASRTATVFVPKSQDKK